VNSHSSVPVNLPIMSVKRRTINTTLTADVLVDLSTSPAQAFPTPGSGTAYYASGDVQQWTYTANQNNVVNNNLYAYWIVIVDENGTGSIAGNWYIGFTLGYTAVANMAFQ
jgi:hypothetical protein